MKIYFVRAGKTLGDKKERYEKALDCMTIIKTPTHSGGKHMASTLNVGVENKEPIVNSEGEYCSFSFSVGQLPSCRPWIVLAVPTLL